MRVEDTFLASIEKSSTDKAYRDQLKNRLFHNHSKVQNAKKLFSDLDLAKSRAAFIKNKVLENLDKYLIEFESNFTKKGGKIIWAKDNSDAIAEISKIIEKKSSKRICKSRSLIFDEIDLRRELIKIGIHPTDIDIADFIQNKNGEKSFHPIYPNIDLSNDKIRELIDVKGNEQDLNAQALSDKFNKDLKTQLSEFDIGISGSSCLVAETGTVVMFENEGCNAQISAFPKTHIVLAGIDEIIANSNEIDLFFHLFSTHSEGMFSNAYMHLISGPKQSEESDGPEEMIVILLDNGRSNILAQVPQRSALSCIKCGACINVCPVYNNIGGAAYQSVFTGPIGAILTPVIKGMDDYKFLNYASTSGMEAVSECPVKINFPKLIQSNRTNSVKEQPAGKTEKLALFFWKTAMLKRSNMDKGGMKLKNFMLRQFFKKSWGERREIPLVANKSFNQLWRERKGIK